MAKRLSRKVANRKFVVLGVIAAFSVVLVLFADLPTPSELHSTVQSLGSIGPVLFFVAYAVITIAPVPRTVFTVSAGLLFGPVLGVGLAVSATTVAALLAFLLVRYLGRDWVVEHLPDHKTMTAIDHHLERRGWLAVVSIRLTALPFSPVNYVCGLSGLHGVPYTVATFFGVIPTTVAGVVVGDSILTGFSPQMFIAVAVCTLVGVIGLVVDAKTPIHTEASDDPGE